MNIRFKAYVMLIVAVSTTSACSSTRSRFCDNIKVRANGSATIEQHQRMGIYHKEKDLVNNKSAYKHLHRDQFLYISDSGEWRIGSERGGSSRGIKNNDCSYADPPVAPQCKAGWEYYYGGWMEDRTITLNCIGPLTCNNNNIQDNGEIGVDCGVEGCSDCPLTEGCDNIEVQSNGSAANIQNVRMGIYLKQNNQKNGKNVYKHKYRAQFVWRNVDGIWAIGSDAQDMGMINKGGCFYADPPVAPHCNTKWLYYENGWNEDDTIHLECIHPSACNGNKLKDNGEIGIDCGGGGCRDCNFGIDGLTGKWLVDTTKKFLYCKKLSLNQVSCRGEGTYLFDQFQITLYGSTVKILKTSHTFGRAGNPKPRSCIYNGNGKIDCGNHKWFATQGHFLTEDGGLCKGKTLVDDIVSCRNAVKLIQSMYPDIPSNVTEETVRNYPKGCYLWIDGDDEADGIYFNDHDSGKRALNTMQVCFKNDWSELQSGRAFRRKTEFGSETVYLPN